MKYKVEINTKNESGNYDVLIPDSDSTTSSFNNSGSNLRSNNVDGALKELDKKAETNAKNIQETKINVGTLSNLTTTDKTSVVNALNEVDKNNKRSEVTANNADKKSKVNERNLNELRDNTINKTLQNLDSVMLNQQMGYYIDSKAFKEYVEKAVIHGTNSNGNYYKFYDGTLICTKTISKDIYFTTPWGVMWGQNSLIDLGKWAQSFISTPVTFVNVYGGGYSGFCLGVENTTETNCGGTYLYRPLEGDGLEHSSRFAVIGIGRWK